MSIAVQMTMPRFTCIVRKGVKHYRCEYVNDGPKDIGSLKKFIKTLVKAPWGNHLISAWSPKVGHSLDLGRLRTVLADPLSFLDAKLAPQLKWKRELGDIRIACQIVNKMEQALNDEMRLPVYTIDCRSMNAVDMMAMVNPKPYICPDTSVQLLVENMTLA
jgi:hypothetical protein